MHKKKKIWITNTTVVTSLGENIDELWHALMFQKTAIKPITRFSTNGYKSKIAGCIDSLKIIPSRSMIHSLIDELIKDIGPVPSHSMLITATTKGGIDNLERSKRGEPYEIDDLAPFSMTNCISKKLGLKGPSLNINAACASSTIAIARGADLISVGICDCVLVCCIDIITEFVLSGFSSIGALSPFPCRPFDRDRDGLSLGEGGAALLLMSRDYAKKNNRKYLGAIEGWGSSTDAAHLTAPDRNGEGLRRAILAAINQASLEPEKIAAISAHGTGTIFNDEMELNAFEKIFKDHKIPIYSVKGAIGHTLGAAGGIEAVLSLKALMHEKTPPTVGLKNPERLARDQVSSSSQLVSGDYLLTTNSGFGGINAAIIIKKGKDK